MIAKWAQAGIVEGICSSMLASASLVAYARPCWCIDMCADAGLLMFTDAGLLLR